MVDYPGEIENVDFLLTHDSRLGTAARSLGLSPDSAVDVTVCAEQGVDWSGEGTELYRFKVFFGARRSVAGRLRIPLITPRLLTRRNLANG